jgi:hypothetical protein
MKNKKVIVAILCIFALICGFFTVDIFFITRPYVETAFQKALVVICAALLAFITFMLAYGAWLLKDKEPNYFLYDKILGKNISVDNLTFKMVNDKMTLYISQIGETEESLWIGNTLSDSTKIGTPAEFRIVLAYKMLFDLAESNDEQRWNMFYEVRKDTVYAIAKAIHENGDTEMARTLTALRNSEEKNVNHVKDFILNNKPYIQGRMLKFVKKNIELFY